MTGKEIKTERKMHNVARELAADLRKKLANFGGYRVTIEPGETQDNVYVTGDYQGDIITETAFVYARCIINTYSEIYSYGKTSITWHIGSMKLDGEYTGAIVICIGRSY